MDLQADNIRFQFSKHLFWDINISELDMEQHANYVVERVLERGRMNDWLLIKNYYGVDRLREIATGLKCLSPKSLSFISIITRTPENQFRCYELLQSKNRHWFF